MSTAGTPAAVPDGSTASSAGWARRRSGDAKRACLTRGYIWFLGVDLGPDVAAQYRLAALPCAVLRSEQVDSRGHPAAQGRAEITGPPSWAAAQASACRGGRERSSRLVASSSQNPCAGDGLPG